MRISVIIPTYNEAAVIERTIAQVKSRAATRNIQEILVVDGHSADGTSQLAEHAGARVVHSDVKGRGAQLEFGAKQAKGGILYFLHADSLPPKGFDEDIIECVRSGKGAGCFQMRFDKKALIFRIYGWFTRFNWIFCRGGDQSLFVTRALYKKTGGFNANYRIFEDIDIIERIRKIEKLEILPHKIVTSARRYEDNGFYRLQLLFAMLHLKYRAGSSPEKLLQYYQRHIK